MSNSYIIAVDFDGTCVEHEYPNIGLDVEGAVETLRTLNNKGHRLILFTMRSGDKLDKAVKWFKDRKRNFEAGILTDDLSLVDVAADHFNSVWSGEHCKTCKRKAYCADRIK